MSANGSATSAAQARVDAVVGHLPPRLQRLVQGLVDAWPGRVVIRSTASFIRIETFDRAMTIGRVIAWVNEIESNELLLLCLFQNALAERRVEHARENRDDGKAEHGLGCNAPVRGPTTLRED